MKEPFKIDYVRIKVIADYYEAYVNTKIALQLGNKNEIEKCLKRLEEAKK